MEKQKHSPKTKRLSRRTDGSIIGVFIVFAFFPAFWIAFLLVSPIYYNGSINQTSLPEELRPTAESLLNLVPLDEAVALTDDVSMQIHTTGFGENTICFDAGYVPLPDYLKYSGVFVNGERIRGAMNATLAYRFGDYQSLNKCVHGELESGLHLLEFHLRDSYWGEPIATQQWAFEVD